MYRTKKQILIAISLVATCFGKRGFSPKIVGGIKGTSKAARVFAEQGRHAHLVNEPFEESALLQAAMTTSFEPGQQLWIRLRNAAISFQGDGSAVIDDCNFMRVEGRTRTYFRDHEIVWVAHGKQHLYTRVTVEEVVKDILLFNFHNKELQEFSEDVPEQSQRSLDDPDILTIPVQQASA